MPSTGYDRIVIEDVSIGEARAVQILIKVVPGSSRDEIAGVLGDRMKVRVSAPAESGRANRAVRELLARAFGVSGRGVEIVSGHGGPLKTVRILGCTAAEVGALIGPGPRREEIRG